MYTKKIGRGDCKMVCPHQDINCINKWMTSGWLSPTELPGTNEIQRETRIIGNFSWVRFKSSKPVPTTVQSGSRRFSIFEPPQSHVKLHHRPYDPCSHRTSVVWGGSVGLNHPKLISSSTPGLVPCVVLWFKQVLKSWTTPNSWEITLTSLFPLELSGLRKFGRVELRTPNLCQAPPLGFRGNRDHRVLSHVVQLFWTYSNHSTTEGTRPVVDLDMSLGWFNPTEPPGTTEVQRKQRS